MGTIRLCGMVLEGSVQRSGYDPSVRFIVTDGLAETDVIYTGALPDLFREGQGVVAQGSLRRGVLQADEVLAKHDENYMPPEVADALAKARAISRVW